MAYRVKGRPVTRTGPAQQAGAPPVATSGSTNPDLLAKYKGEEHTGPAAVIIPQPAVDAKGKSTITVDKSSTMSGLPSAHAEILSKHNALRATHSAPALTWDPDLADSAAAVAQKFCMAASFDDLPVPEPGTNVQFRPYYIDEELDLRLAFREW